MSANRSDRTANEEDRDDDRVDAVSDPEYAGEERGINYSENIELAIIAVGIGLILFPEPASSGFGAILVGIGVAMWLADAVT